MKKYILIFIFAFLFIFAKANNSNIDTPLRHATVERNEPAIVFSKVTNSDYLTTNSQIDLLDTVVFDLSQAIITGTSIDIPISIISDDTINALDFSLKYDQVKLLYDSIIDLTTYLQAVSFYNSNDSTIRFTSNSFQQYGNNIPLVNIRFTLLSGSVAITDLGTVKAYLNGIKCSIKFTNTIASGITENSNPDQSIIVYPNPAHETVHFKLAKPSDVILFDAAGKEVIKQFDLHAFVNYDLNISNLSTGLYFLKVKNDLGYFFKKIIIQ